MAGYRTGGAFPVNGTVDALMYSPFCVGTEETLFDCEFYADPSLSGSDCESDMHLGVFCDNDAGKKSSCQQDKLSFR